MVEWLPWQPKICNNSNILRSIKLILFPVKMVNVGLPRSCGKLVALATEKILCYDYHGNIVSKVRRRLPISITLKNPDYHGSKVSICSHCPRKPSYLILSMKTIKFIEIFMWLPRSGVDSKITGVIRANG